jgi:protein-tyrosine phosphatase
MKTVLFLCTGNYYRSRFAEELFNHLAPQSSPGWRAASRGIAVDRGIYNIGPIHAATAKALASAGVPFDLSAARMPLRLTSADMDAADHIVALKADEHLSLLRERFRAWTDANESRVEFWHVHDTDLATPETALPQITTNVVELLQRLSSIA